MSVNRVILVGRLGGDPETRYTSSGQAVCNFSLATDETFKDRSGEKQKKTEWHRIVVWGKQAEIAQQYLTKGALLYLEGKIQSRQWDDREGNKRTSTDIVVSSFRMLGGGKRQESDQQQPAQPQDPPSTEISDEDIPF